MTKKEMFVFAWADVFGGGGQAIISVMYMIFLTDIIGIGPAFAGTTILISKLWDAVNDPMMGVISDNTRSRFGRRKPYILAGSFLIIVAIALLWLPVVGFSAAGKAAYVLFAYLFYNTVATIIAVPYSSLSTEITTDYQQRNSVNILRLVFSTAATALCTLTASVLFSAYTGGKISLSALYFSIVFGFGLFFALPLFLTGLIAQERTPVPHDKVRFNTASFALPLKSRPFRFLLVMYICQSISMDILSTTIMYYSLYVVRGIAPTVFLGIFIGLQLLMFPLIQYAVKRSDKNKIYYFGLPLSILAAAAVSLYPSNLPAVGAYVLTALLAVGFAGSQLMSWIIFPDVIDAHELKTGVRNAGSFSGLMTFVRKASSAVVIQVFGLVLFLCGYIKPERGESVTQPASVLWGVRLTILIGFVTLMSIAYFVAKRYPLKRDTCERIQKYIGLLREGGEESLSEQDRARLYELREEV